MKKIEEALYDLKRFELFSYQESIIHNIDPRIKTLTTLFFIAFVISFNRFQAMQLVPFFLFPLVIAYSGNISLAYILKRVLIVSPFAILLAIINLISDNDIIGAVFFIPITSGWLSAASIIMRFFLTVSTTFLLITTTGFYSFCYALRVCIHLPAIFITQLLFLYRYIFVLVEESIRMLRAYQTRAFRSKIPIHVFIHLLGNLLLRTINRAERIYLAMLARGYDGRIYIPARLQIKGCDIIFIVCWLLFFIAARTLNLPLFIGKIVIGLVV